MTHDDSEHRIAQYVYCLTEYQIAKNVAECKRACLIAAITVVFCAFLAIVALACAITP